MFIRSFLFSYTQNSHARLDDKKIAVCSQLC